MTIMPTRIDSSSNKLFQSRPWNVKTYTNVLTNVQYKIMIFVDKCTSVLQIQIVD